MAGPEPHVHIGQIVGTHGVKGGLKVLPLTDFPARFEAGEVLFLKGVARKVKRSNWHKGQARIQLEGINDMTTAEALKWEFLSVPESSRPELEEGEFLASDLVGMMVVTESGQEIGPVDEVVPSPGQDLFRVGEVLIPVVKEFVKDIDGEKRVITVALIPGMLPGEDEPEDAKP
jgi:16S rRNA processing protein RimM